jgi:hypothetical protein
LFEDGGHQYLHFLDWFGGLQLFQETTNRSVMENGSS